MGELFGIVIVVAVLIGVYSAYGPKAMLAVIAVPAVLGAFVLACLVFGSEHVAKSLGLGLFILILFTVVYLADMGSSNRPRVGPLPRPDPPSPEIAPERHFEDCRTQEEVDEILRRWSTRNRR